MGVAAVTLFYGAPFAEVAGTGTKPKSLPCAAKKDGPLKVGESCFHICFGVEVNEDGPVVGIKNFPHLLRCRGKRRTDKALAVAVAAKLALEPDPGSGGDLGGTDYADIDDAGFFSHNILQIRI